jgi:hypothetical protein
MLDLFAVCFGRMNRLSFCFWLYIPQTRHAKIKLIVADREAANKRIMNNNQRAYWYMYDTA